jgi:pyruvate,water dikinase
VPLATPASLGAGLGRKLDAQEKEVELLDRWRALPDGERKADETERTIDRVRMFIGYREYELRPAI